MGESSATLLARPAPGPIEGELRPPGDKSISHRALILATLAEGESRVEGLLQAQDVEATAAACRVLGAGMERDGSVVRLRGAGQGGLSAPDGPLDMGNSGTAMRLLAGVLAAQPFDSVLVGDRSLMQRPMERIAAPLREMGAVISTGAGGRAPLEIEGSHALTGITYHSPVASAQVKSCILLAGLYASGETRVIEPSPSRDHTERMLRAFGAEMAGDVGVRGGRRLAATDLEVPADISSAAFFLAAAALVPGSHVYLKSVGLNPTRAGIVDALVEMGCDIRVDERGDRSAEPAGNVELRWSPGLRAIEIEPGQVPAIIDELPVLMAVASLAEGVSRIRGARELRVKESDRIAVMAVGLESLGFRVRQYADGLDIEGRPKPPSQGDRTIELNAEGDHRCAMSFCVLAQAIGCEVRIRNAAEIDTSYPAFVRDLAALGGSVGVEEEMHV